MWSIYEKKVVIKVLKKMPRDVAVKYEAWKRIVELEGPQGLKFVKGFHDEALKGKWKGFRSSRLGLQWRIIYAIEGDHLEVFVVELTPHDYRKR